MSLSWCPQPHAKSMELRLLTVMEGKMPKNQKAFDLNLQKLNFKTNKLPYTRNKSNTDLNFLTDFLSA